MRTEAQSNHSCIRLGLIGQYRCLFPVTESAPVINLYEGTPPAIQQVIEKVL